MASIYKSVVSKEVYLSRNTKLERRRRERETKESLGS